MKRNIWVSLLTLLIFFLSNGCASSNLHLRPQWAKESTLPIGLEKSYPSSRFLVQVVNGTGKTLKEAEQAAHDEARSRFAQMIIAKISSIYRKKTEILATAYQKQIKKQIHSYFHKVCLNPSSRKFNLF